MRMRSGDPREMRAGRSTGEAVRTSGVQYSGRSRGAALRRVRIWGATVAAMLVLVAALLAAVGCGTNQKATTPSASPARIAVTDDAGRAFTLQKPATRIVSLAPAQTEMVYAVGAGDRVVGVSDFCDYPQDAKDVDKVGDFANPNVEKIISLKPDLVLAASGVQSDAAARLDELNVPVVVLDPATLDGVFEDLEKLGLLVGEQAKAKALVDSLHAVAKDVETRISGRQRLKVFFEIYSKPLMTAGKGTLIEDLVRRAGGANIGSSAGVGYPEFSQEVLITEDPDVYIAVAGAQAEPGDIAKRPAYNQLTAVKEGRVFVIEDNLVVRSGPRALQGLRQIAAFLHPDAFEGSE